MTGEEVEEIKGPKRKYFGRIRRDAGLRKGQEEAEELSFVPSVISVPLKPLFHCDNQCSEKTSASGSWRRWCYGKVRNHTRPIYARNATTIL